jgi:hypothetical protein
MMTREDVTLFSAVVAVCTTLLAGLAYDAGQMGLTWSLGIIAAGSLCASLLAYLGNYTDNSGD